MSRQETSAKVDMASGKRRSKVPVHWWALVESMGATARYDQETPGVGEHTWRLVPVVANPKAVAPPPPPPPAPPPTVMGKGVSDGRPLLRETHLVATAPAPKATPTPPKADTKATPAPKAKTPTSPAMDSPQVGQGWTRKGDPRLPAIGVVQTFTHKSGTVYTWKVIDDRGRVHLSGGNIDGEEFSSVSSAAAKINHGTSTNGYLFFGLGKKA